MTDENFRSVFGRLDGGPMELDAEFDAKLRERLIAALSVDEAVEDTVEGAEAPTQTVIDMGESWKRQPRRSLWRRRALVLAVAAAALVAFAVVVIPRGSDDAEVVPPAGDTATAASAPESTGSVAVVPAAPAGWSNAPVPECDEPSDQAIGPDGVLWVANVGLYRWDGQWTHLTHEDGLPAGSDFDPNPELPSGGPCGADSQAPAVSDVEVAPDGTVWIANGAGISSYDGSEFTVVADYPGGVVPETFSGYLRVDGNGNVWFPTFVRAEEPVTDVDPQTGEPYVDPETGEPAVTVTETLTGLARLDGSDWTEFPIEPSVEPFGLRPLVADDGTAYFVGSDAIYGLVDATWLRIDSELPGGDRFGTSAATGPDGSLWMSVTDSIGVDPETGTERLTALAQWDGSSWIMHTEEIPAAFWQPIVAADGTLWAAIAPSGETAFGGLVSYDGVNWTVHPIEGVESDCAPPWLTAHDGTIWVSGPWCNPVRYNPSG